MSTFGKVLVVLVLVASGGLLGALATLFAYRTDYKAALAQEKRARAADVASRDADIQKLRDDLGLREAQATALRTTMEKLRTDLTSAQADAKNWQDKHSTLSTDLAKLTDQFKAIADQIAEKDKVIQELTANMQKAREDLELAQTDRTAAEQHALDLSERLKQAEKNLIDLEKAYVAVVKRAEGQ